ncbi:hypothetical protein C7999DRAFT_14288 [Corynascus novoguineensis]|uniref:DUF6594 domain-containing protein n=1 Tax=Corynascus novoguineensis TaxID=1126955 RepID=A0AAN7HJ70_9PEZI|nr:hypothetical protein C7999DRAFT_14288 [Corynascus novoguineensis]
MDLDRYLGAQIPLDFNNPKPWVLSRHIENLVFRVEGEPDKKAQKTREKNDIGDRHFHMSFAELQRMRLRELQCRLVKYMVDMRIDPRTPVNWEADLKEYIQAVRDYDFMTECSQRANDPFDVSAERLTDDEIMQRAAWVRNAWQTDNELRTLDPIAPLGTAPWSKSWESKRNPIGGTRHASIRKTWYGAFFQRLGFSFVGGVFLLAPMWIMVLHKTRRTCLITTTAFVVVFGTILAWRMEKPADVLAATLAYAAVLVVFVGLAVEGDGSVQISPA